MNFLEFKNRLFELVCFNIHQVYAWQPGFDRNNFVRWSKKGLIIRLRQGYYTFPEYLGKPDYAFFFANRIYRPSYISLHSALAFYGMIPEAVVRVTSVTSLKTITFTNTAGEFIYRSLKEDLIFGYELKPVDNRRNVQIANPEKALLDLLYIDPFYNTADELTELRLDDDFMHSDFNTGRFLEYAGQFSNRELEKRAAVLIKTYGL